MQKRAERTLSEASGDRTQFQCCGQDATDEERCSCRANIRTAEDDCCNVILFASQGRGGISDLLLESEMMKVPHTR